MKVFSEFKDAKFYDHNHTYELNGERMKSVTTVIKEYGNDFDTKYWTTYKALQAMGKKVRPIDPENHIIGIGKRKYTVDKLLTVEEVARGAEVLRVQWERKAERGQDKGTAAHKYMEDAIWGKYPENPIAYLDEVVCDILAKYDPIRTEAIVYSEKYMISGQLDLLVRNKEGLTIIDFKTDEEIKQENKYQNFKFPIDHLEESTINKYTLQLNIYRHLLELKGVEVNEMKIIHLQDPKSTWYDIERISVKELLDDYHKKRTIHV